MKFFTMNWWAGIQETAQDPFYEYRVHLNAIREQIPKDLLMLQETISLHDAHLREMDYTTTSNTLDIKLDGDDGKGGLRQFRLHYSNVVSFHTSANPDIGLPGPYGYGDLGYYEADITADGKIEHRILFSSGIELQIVFGELKLSWKDVETTQ